MAEMTEAFEPVGEIEKARLLQSVREVANGPGIMLLRRLCNDHTRQAQRIEALEKALGESVKLQAHYAELLNGWDSGERRIFKTVEEWMERLADVEASHAALTGGDGHDR